MKRVLLLGGTGLVGSYLRAELSGTCEMVTTSTTGDGSDRAFDVRSREAAAEFAREPFDAVVNCTVRHNGTLGQLFDVNVAGAAHLAEAFSSRPVHFVQVSTLSANPENRVKSSYGLTKFLADELLLGTACGGPWKVSVLRFSQIFDASGKSARAQPGLHRWVTQLGKGEPVDVFTGGDAPRSYIPVEIVAKAIARTLSEGLVGAHDVIAPERYTPLELATLLARFAGKDPALIRQHPDKQAASYAIPACSEAFRRWYSTNGSTDDYLGELARKGSRDG